MRLPQLARCSRDQLRRRMGQHGAALGRGRGGGCEVFRAPPSLGRQLEARQRAGRRAASESTVAHYSPRAHVPLSRRLRPGLWLCGLKSPGSRLRPPFFGDVTFFHTVPDAARWRRSTRQVRLSPAPPAPARGPAYSPAPRTDPARACRQEPRLFPLLTLARSSIDRHRGHPHKSAAQRTAGAPTPMNLGVGTGPKGCARKRKYTSTP